MSDQHQKKCSCRLMLFLLGAQQDRASRWGPLKRPNHHLGGGGVGKWMLPIREAQGC